MANPAVGSPGNNWKLLNDNADIQGEDTFVALTREILVPF